MESFFNSAKTSESPRNRSSAVEETIYYQSPEIDPYWFAMTAAQARNYAADMGNIYYALDDMNHVQSKQLIPDILFRKMRSFLLKQTPIMAPTEMSAYFKKKAERLGAMLAAALWPSVTVVLGTLSAGAEMVLVITGPCCNRDK